MALCDQFTAEDLAQAVRIDGSRLVWARTNSFVTEGDLVGSLCNHGYYKFNFRGVTVRVHRVVWLLTHGEWPSMPIDHIDGCKTNNAPSNLRLATLSQNMANRKPRNKWGFKGITPLQNGRWQAHCARRTLGNFATPEEAARAYDAAASERFGAYAWLNFPGVNYVA